MNRSFTSFIIREMHIKRITRCHYTPVRAQIQTTDNVVRMGSNVNSHSLLVGTQKRYRQTRWGTVLRFPTKVNILLLHTAIAVLDIYPEHLKTKVHTKTCATTLQQLYSCLPKLRSNQMSFIAAETNESDTSHQVSISRC